ncbi:MAG: hypothetical protein Q9217_003418 [Psora testacea]
MAETQAPQMGPMASVKKHLPVRNFSAKYTAKPPAGLPEFQMIKPSGTTVGVVLAITEARPSTSGSAKAPEVVISPAEDIIPKPRPRRPTLTIPSQAHISQQERPEASLALPPPPPPSFPRDAVGNPAPSPAEVPLPRSTTNTPTLICSNSECSTAVEQTPVMRSLFPSYNPNVPLAQQHYYPTMEAAPALARMREVAGSSTSAPQPQQGSGSARLALARQVVEPKESLLRRSESTKRPTSFSKQEELVGLWSMANGQATGGAADSYNLELSWSAYAIDNLPPFVANNGPSEDLTLNSEIITFSGSSSAPLYALSASANNHISTTRIHPQDPRTKIPICTSTFSQPTRQNPLITSIFPKLAGLMAVDQSSSLAVARKLDRQASQLVQAEAIAQAQEREGSLLLWDCDSGRFCLMHPTLLDNAATTIRIEISPNPASPETIIFFAPETEMPLLSLSMQDLTLTLRTAAIRALPSLYILDTLITALLTLLLHLHRSCADPSTPYAVKQQQEQQDDIESTLYFPPPPPSLHSKASKRDLRRQRTQSRFPTFRSPRSVKSTKSLVSSYDADRDIELGKLESNTGHAVDNAVGGKSKQQRPKGVFDANDPSLPKGTRAVLKFLYWIFEVVYWILGVMVQILVAIVVGIGKFVTKL